MTIETNILKEMYCDKMSTHEIECELACHLLMDVYKEL